MATEACAPDARRRGRGSHPVKRPGANLLPMPWSCRRSAAVQSPAGSLVGVDECREAERGVQLTDASRLAAQAEKYDMTRKVTDCHQAVDSAPRSPGGEDAWRDIKGVSPAGRRRLQGIPDIQCRFSGGDGEALARRFFIISSSHGILVMNHPAEVPVPVRSSERSPRAAMPSFHPDNLDTTAGGRSPEVRALCCLVATVKRLPVVNPCWEVGESWRTSAIRSPGAGTRFIRRARRRSS